MNEKDKYFNLQGDKKVKVEEVFASKIKSFWKDLIGKKDNKRIGFLKKIGARAMAKYSNKSVEELLEEDIKNEIQSGNEANRFNELIEKLKTEVLTEEEIDKIVNECKKIRENGFVQITNLLGDKEIAKELKSDLKQERVDNFAKLTDIIREAKNIAMSKIAKEEEKTEDVPPFQTFGVEPAKTQTMTAVPDDAPTAIPVKEPEEDMELEEPEVEMPELEEPDLEEEAKPEETTEQEIKDSEDIASEPEIDEENKEEAELEEPVVSEGIDITDEMTSNTIDLSDLTQFFDYSEYLTAYRQDRIDIKDVDKFYNDLFSGNIPNDLLDKEAFKTVKQRQEDEIEYKKLEAERAETEKRLKEIEEKQAALSEEHAELQTRFADRDAKLAALRKDNVSLKQELVDKDGQLKDRKQEINGLQGQLTTAQEVAKKAQAKSYEDRKALSEIEKELAKEKAHAKELEYKLRTSEKEAAETKRELEATRARISENTEAALKQINSLRTPSDDDLENTALDWAEKQIKELPNEKEGKKGPKHFAEKKSKHMAPKEETKEEVKEPEIKAEEAKDTPSFELPEPVEIKEPVFEPEKELETTQDEPKIIGLSTTPDSELQGVVTQDNEGHVDIDFKPLDELKAQREDLEATRADLVSAIEQEAAEPTNSEEPKTR